jgi:hypothetical protein
MPAKQIVLMALAAMLNFGMTQKTKIKNVLKIFFSGTTELFKKTCLWNIP